MASSVIKNYKPMQALTGTTGAVGAGVSLAYPSGFTMNNSVIIGLQFKNPSENLWRTMGMVNENIACAISAIMTPTEILVVPRNSMAENSQFKVSLYRYQ